MDGQGIAFLAVALHDQPQQGKTSAQHGKPYGRNTSKPVELRAWEKPSKDRKRPRSNDKRVERRNDRYRRKRRNENREEHRAHRNREQDHEREQDRERECELVGEHSHRNHKSDLPRDRVCDHDRDCGRDLDYPDGRPETFT